MPTLYTGPIENAPVNGVRATQQFSVKITNRSSTLNGTVYIEGYILSNTRTLYVQELFSIAPNQVITKTFAANFDAFEFNFTTGGAAEKNIEVSAWGKNTAGQLVTAQRLVSSELIGA